MLIITLVRVCIYIDMFGGLPEVELKANFDAVKQGPYARPEAERSVLSLWQGVVMTSNDARVVPWMIRTQQGTGKDLCSGVSELQEL